MNSLRLSISLGVLLGATTMTDARAGPPKGDDGAPRDGFDKQAAAAALGSVDLTKCRATNAAKGEGHVMVTFAPTGTAQTATVDKGPMVGTPVAKCIAGKFKQAKVPAFKGDVVQVGKTFRFE
jgi:hypothetical protein